MTSKFFSKIYCAWEKKQIKKYEKILDIFKECEIDIKNCKCLNIGCSNFFLEKFLLEKNLFPKNFISIDVDKSISKEYKLLRKNFLKNKITFILASGDKLPFNKESFDIIFCIDVIHLLKNLNDVYYVLNSKGYLVVASFFNIYDEENIKYALYKKMRRFKILKECLLINDENEIIVLAKK